MNHYLLIISYSFGKKQSALFLLLFTKITIQIYFNIVHKFYKSYQHFCIQSSSAAANRNPEQRSSICILKYVYLGVIFHLSFFFFSNAIKILDLPQEWVTFSSAAASSEILFVDYPFSLCGLRHLL